MVTEAIQYYIVFQKLRQSLGNHHAKFHEDQSNNKKVIAKTLTSVIKQEACQKTGVAGGMFFYLDV